jgi:hypothetical protein
VSRDFEKMLPHFSDFGFGTSVFAPRWRMAISKIGMGGFITNLVVDAAFVVMIKSIARPLCRRHGVKPYRESWEAETAPARRRIQIGNVWRIFPHPASFSTVWKVAVVQFPGSCGAFHPVRIGAIRSHPLRQKSIGFL